MKELESEGASLDKLVSGGTAYQTTTVIDGVHPKRKNNRIVKRKIGKAEVNEEES